MLLKRLQYGGTCNTPAIPASAALDVRGVSFRYHTLERLTDAGKATIVGTHDLGILATRFTRAVFLDRRVIADGPVKEVLTPETIARSYGFEFHQDLQGVSRRG